MVELAREFGSAVKFPGSGGAVIGLCLDSQKMVNIYPIGLANYLNVSLDRLSQKASLY